MQKVVQFPRKDFAGLALRSCANCAHFSKDPTYVPASGCMHFPQDSLHFVTRERCVAPERALWAPIPPKDGWLKRFLRWVW